MNFSVAGVNWEAAERKLQECLPCTRVKSLFGNALLD